MDSLNNPRGSIERDLSRKTIQDNVVSINDQRRMCNGEYFKFGLVIVGV